MPITSNGFITRGTRQNLIDGLRGRPISDRAVDAILEQAITFTRRLVETYEAQVAPREVGIGGTGRATEEEIIGDKPPTALLYGRVQSGKTAAMILTSALCLDNGFHVVIVVTADNVALVEQTADRFRALNGPRVFSTTGGDADYEWVGREEAIAEDIATDGLVLVCAKDSFHLPAVIRFLQQVDASSYPAIIFDDEADTATPDTTLEARTSGRATAPRYPSTIFRRVLENAAPNEEGESISEILPHSLYVQVTATPFLFFLQRQDARIRPSITQLLEPGEGYTGGEEFFANFDPAARQSQPPIVLLDDNEALAIPRRPVPRGLAASINFFLVAAAARVAAQDRRWPPEGFKHLSHPSVRIQQHALVAGHIERHLDRVRRQLREDLASAGEVLGDAYRELRRSFPDAQPLEDLAPLIFDAIRQAQVFRVNQDTELPRYGPRVSFLVGGNILGRGLTIDDLLVTYYVREAQTSQMDTVWQHARMYGYRMEQMPSTRVYLPRRLATLFREIHRSEEQLREVLRLQQQGEFVPVRVANRSRPTRRNVTEPNALRVVGGNFDQWNPLFVQEDRVSANNIRLRLLELNVPTAEPDRERRTTRIPLAALLELVDAIPMRPNDSGRWDPDVVRIVLESYGDQFDGLAPIYVRALEAEEPPADGWIRGRLSGPEIAIIRAAARGVPALALMYLGGEEAPRGWYPTLVLPEDRARYIINPS